MLHVLSQTPTLLIASVPWLVARTMEISGRLIVNRSLELATTDAMYQPVIAFLKQHPHSIQSGPQKIRDEDMHGGWSEMTIYRLEVP